MSTHDSPHDPPVAYDDPVARTRLAWSRTLLVVVGVALLVGRGAYLVGQLWWLPVLGGVALATVVVGLARMRVLAKRGPGSPQVTPRAVVAVSAGLLVMVVVAILTA